MVKLQLYQGRQPVPSVLGCHKIEDEFLTRSWCYWCSFLCEIIGPTQPFNCSAQNAQDGRMCVLSLARTCTPRRATQLPTLCNKLLNQRPNNALQIPSLSSYSEAVDDDSGVLCANPHNSNLA